MILNNKLVYNLFKINMNFYQTKLNFLILIMNFNKKNCLKFNIFNNKLINQFTGILYINNKMIKIY